MTDATDARLAAQYEAYPFPPATPATRQSVSSSAVPAICARSTTGCSAPAGRVPAAAGAGRRRRHRRRDDHAGAADGARRAAGQRDLARPFRGRAEDRPGAGGGAGSDQHRLGAALAAGTAGLGARAVRLHRLLRRAAPSARSGGGPARAAVGAGARRRAGADGVCAARPHRRLHAAGRAAAAGAGRGGARRAAGRGEPGHAASAGDRLAARNGYFWTTTSTAAMRGSTTCCSTRATAPSPSASCTRCWRARAWRSPAGSSRCATTRAAAAGPASCARASRRSIRSIAPRWPRRWRAMSARISSTACARTNRRSARDFMAADAVPVLRELSGRGLADGIQPDGTITLVFDGLRLPVPLPPMAPAILRLVDGRRRWARSPRRWRARHRRRGVRARLACHFHRAGADQPPAAGGAGLRISAGTTSSCRTCAGTSRRPRSPRAPRR